jgi:hypothetical protein
VAVPTLDALWRPNDVGPQPKTRDDRELIRSYSNQPAAELVYHDLTVVMNRLASVSPAGVAQIQGWINEIETLESDWAGQVADGNATYAQATEYEGPLPGATIERADMLSQADVLKWDTDLKKVKFKTAPGANTQAGNMGQRIADLKGRILTALDLLPRYGGIVRS